MIERFVVIGIIFLILSSFFTGYTFSTVEWIMLGGSGLLNLQLILWPELWERRDHA